MQIQCEYEIRQMSFYTGFAIYAKHKIPNKFFKLSIIERIYVNTEDERFENWYTSNEAIAILTKESEMIKILKNMFEQTKEYRDLMKEPSNSDIFHSVLKEKIYTKHKGITLNF